MTVNAAVEAELGFLRSEAEGRMTSRVTVYRANGRATAPGSIKERTVWDAAYADLPFRLHPKATVRTVTTAGVDREVTVRIGSMPAVDPIQPTWPDGTERVLQLRDDDRLLCTSGRHQGSVWRVIDGDVEGETASRVQMVADSAPAGGWS